MPGNLHLAKRTSESRRTYGNPVFFDRRIRDSLEYQKFKDYIWQNPVKRFLARTPGEYPYSSAKSTLPTGPRTSAGKADFFSSYTEGLNSCSTP